MRRTQPEGLYLVWDEGPATTRPDESLVNTYWKLTALDGESPDVVDGQREPHFVLHADPARAMGSTGCNRMMGNYRCSGTQQHSRQNQHRHSSPNRHIDSISHGTSPDS